MANKISLTPIGIVENSITEMLPPEQIKQQPSRVVLKPELAAGLEGLQPGQNIMIVFHFHKAPTEYELRQHPKRDASRPKKGIFALRSPQRPNGIGITTVELLKVEDNILYIRGLDALNGSPVLDVKPT
jgi:tRNA-Thr(GGU) m(6)t(6)A37 methyltransferase TsaA